MLWGRHLDPVDVAPTDANLKFSELVCKHVIQTVPPNCVCLHEMRVCVTTVSLDK
jgi:hypothetical protein